MRPIRRIMDEATIATIDQRFDYLDRHVFTSEKDSEGFDKMHLGWFILFCEVGHEGVFDYLRENWNKIQDPDRRGDSIAGLADAFEADHRIYSYEEPMARQTNWDKQRGVPVRKFPPYPGYSNKTRDAEVLMFFIEQTCKGIKLRDDVDRVQSANVQHASSDGGQAAAVQRDLAAG